MDKIAGIWSRVQRDLFPHLEECLSVLTARQRDLVLALETIRVEEHVRPGWMRRLGRTPKDRKALARAFVAKALYNEPTTVLFLERLKADRSLRRICGWERQSEIPSESTTSLAGEWFVCVGNRRCMRT